MRLRTGDYRPSPRALRYDVMGVGVYLLPLDGIGFTRMNRRVAALFEDDTEKHLAALAVALFAAWDAPTIEWRAPLDPDEVMTLEGDALRRACVVLVDELVAPSTVRLGLDVARLVECMSLALRGMEAEKPSGEAPPVES